MRTTSAALFALLALSPLAGCGTDETSGTPASGGGSKNPTGESPSGTPPTNPGTNPTPTNPQDGPSAGNPDGHATLPAEAQAEDVSTPTTVIGTGTAVSCTAADFV